MSKQQQNNRQQNKTGSMEKWLPTIMVAVISTCGFVIVALINRSTAIVTTLKPIEFTQTAEALHYPTKIIVQGSSRVIASTPTALSPTSQITDTPPNTLLLNVRKLEAKDLSINIPSIWIENNIPVVDMDAPGRITFSGFVRAGQEYRFSIYWCAANKKTLSQNMDNIKTSFYVNGKLLPEEYIFTYDHNPEGLKCKYDVIALSGWVAGEEYKLEVYRNILTKIFDGKTSYPAGIYIRELDVTAQ